MNGLEFGKNARLLFISILAVIILAVMGVAVTYGASKPLAKATVNVNANVTVRKSYSTTSSKVTTVKPKTVMNVSAEKFTKKSSSKTTDKWYYTTTYKGYIRGDLIKVTYPNTLKGTVNENSVSVRTGAGTGFTRKYLFNKNKKIDIVVTAYDSAGSKWYKIKYNSGYYYIIAKYVTVGKVSEEKPSEPEKPSPSPSPSPSDSFDKELAKFPSSYRSKIKALHNAHPTWHFKAKYVNLSWKDALAKQCSNYKCNLTTFTGAFRKVDKGTYNFSTKKFIGLDGPYWVAASEQAVAFYMDPRNWLTETGIFMFENMSHDEEAQKESAVKEILSKTKVKTSYSSTYMSAGKKYNVNPVYLASKTYVELGTSTFMIDGKYNGHYNVFNIGCSDSAAGSGITAAQKGLKYAAEGTSYGRPWNTMTKAINGGTQFIAAGFISNKQYTQYYERFNVLNGLNKIGTHQYATAVHNAATLSSITQSTYKDNKMLSTGFSFEIPVYDNMPSTVPSMPASNQSNNNFLDSITVKVDGKTYKLNKTFDRFSNDYSLASSIPSDVSSVAVTAKANDTTSKVTVSGNTSLKTGNNTVKITVKSTSGLSRIYKVTVVKKQELRTE